MDLFQCEIGASGAGLDVKFEDGGAGLDERYKDESEGTGRQDGDSYLLANPRLVEAPDSDYHTSVPRTGVDRSAPKPLMVSNLPYSQHQRDDQHKDGGRKLIDKTRLAENATVHATPARDNYLLAEPSLAEVPDNSTVVPISGADRSVQQTITGTDPPQPQHLNNESYGMIGGKAGTTPNVRLKAKSKDPKSNTIHAKVNIKAITGTDPPQPQHLNDESHCITEGGDRIKRDRIDNGDRIKGNRIEGDKIKGANVNLKARSKDKSHGTN